MGTGGITLSRTEIEALEDVVHGRIVFHNGLWGAEMCYMWSGRIPGRGAGRVLPEKSDALYRLYWRRLIVIQPGDGRTDVPVVVAEHGLSALPGSMTSLAA
jgi:hypothetical protein